MLTLICVFTCDFLRFWRDLGSILGGFGRPKCTQKSSFFENADFVKIVVFLKENCYFSGFGPRKFDEKSRAKIYLLLMSIFWRFFGDLDTI